MKFLEIEVEINGVRETHRHIEKIEHRAQNLKPLFREAEARLQREYTSAFMSNGNGKWAPLDVEYGSWKSINFPGRPTLVRTGKLFNSISPFSVREIRDTKAKFGTNLSIAKFHQYGTWSMPAREIVFIPANFAKEFSEKVADYAAHGRL